MGLKMLDNGQYVVKNKKDAIAALEGAEELKVEIEEAMKEHGIAEMMQDATEMKKAAQAWMIEHDVEQLQCDGFHATKIEAAHDKRWIATDEELVEADSPKGATSLRRIIKKKFKKPSERRDVWNRITRRTADPTGIEEVVAEGLLTDDDVAPAFIEKKKAPYVRIFPDN